MPAKYDGLLEQDYVWQTPAKAGWKVSLLHRTRLAGRIFSHAFLPSTSRSADGTVSPRGQQLRRTAYLDGLRGFAAFLVYWHHHQLWAHEAIHQQQYLEHAFGYEGEYYFACLPGVRIFFNGGHIAVATFFVISGYVLAAKPMSLLHSGDLVKFGDSVGSALFRRWLRLYLPVAATTFAFICFCHLFGIWLDAPTLKSSLREEIWNWYTEFKNFSFVFRGGGELWFSYNFHAWSIPVEFKGSMVVYTSLIALSRCRRNTRLWIEIGLICYFMYIADAAFYSMFTAGIMLCDLDLLARANSLPRIFQRLASYKELIFFNLFLVSLFLAGVPSHDLLMPEIDYLRRNPGWGYLSYLKPQAALDYMWFYLFFASTFLVAAVPRIPLLKAFFETPFNQYLGRISFAFYLVHGPVIWTLGNRVYAAVGFSRDAFAEAVPWWVDKFPLSKSGPLGLEPAFLLSHLILLPATLCLAELGTKVVDEPAVRFANWLYTNATAQQHITHVNGGIEMNGRAAAGDDSCPSALMKA